MNPTWSCPSCRNICNCSICRNRKGKGATGILINLAQSKGFSNVADYLKDLTKKKQCLRDGGIGMPLFSWVVRCLF